MPQEPRLLIHQQATSFYNPLGAKRDWEASYEGTVTRELIAYAAFESAQLVFEFDCGTGVCAKQALLRQEEHTGMHGSRAGGQ